MQLHMIGKTSTWKRAAICIFVFLFFPLFASKANVGTLSAKENVCRLMIQNTKGGKVSLSVEIADNEFRRRKGLMFRQTLPRNAGMLFVFEYEQRLSFWMKNTYIPLDMIFIRGDGRIHRIAEHTEPLSEKMVPSNGPVRGVLEVIAGTARKLGIAPGDRVAHRIFSGR
jgi:uncharacterized membrane protein (UPF0127 family)